MTPIVGGYYRHFKHRDAPIESTEGLYRVECLPRDSETEDRCWVVYRSIATGEYWLRSMAAFCETITRDGYIGSRFAPAHHSPRKP